jgi:hypothetical protein
MAPRPAKRCAAPAERMTNPPPHFISSTHEPRRVQRRSKHVPIFLFRLNGFVALESLQGHSGLELGIMSFAFCFHLACCIWVVFPRPQSPSLHKSTTGPIFGVHVKSPSTPNRMILGPFWSSAHRSIPGNGFLTSSYNRVTICITPPEPPVTPCPQPYI